MGTTIGFLTIAVLGLVAAGDVPSWEPPVMWTESSLPEPSGERDFVSRLNLGSLQVVLEQTMLADVSRRFGAPVGHRGDAGESVSWVCLLGQDEEGPWAVWLESGEIHGGAIGAFLLKRRAPAERFDSRCVELAAPVAIPLPIRLDMSRTEVVRLLGQPLAKSGRTEVYSGCQRVKLQPTGAHEAQDFDLCSSLYVRFKGELVEAFAVWRTTTS
jgi:hypothetical protein